MQNGQRERESLGQGLLALASKTALDEGDSGRAKRGGTPAGGPWWSEFSTGLATIGGFVSESFRPAFGTADAAGALPELSAKAAGILTGYGQVVGFTLGIALGLIIGSRVRWLRARTVTFRRAHSELWYNLFWGIGSVCMATVACTVGLALVAFPPLIAFALDPPDVPYVSDGYRAPGAVSFARSYTLDGGAFAFSPDGLLITMAVHGDGGRGNSIRLHASASGEVVRALADPSTAAVGRLFFSSDGAKLVGMGRPRHHHVWVWEMPAGIITSRGRVPADLDSFDVSPDGGSLLAAATHRLEVWDTESWERVFPPRGGDLRGKPGWYVKFVGFLPGCKRAVTVAAEERVYIWDLTEARVAMRLNGPIDGHWRSLNCGALSADGSLLATGSDDTMVKVWDTNTGRCVSKLRGLWREPEHVAISPKGGLVASLDGAGLCVVWERESERLACAFQAAGGVPKGIAFSPDGARLAVQSSGSVSVWEVVEPE